MNRLLILACLFLTGCAQTDYRQPPYQPRPLTQAEINYYVTHEPSGTPNPFYSNSTNDWTIYQTPHGNYTNLGDGMMLGPDGLYIPY